MQILRDLRELTPNQRNAVLACFLGWTLDAFDFFIIVFVFKDIAKEFKSDIPAVTATVSFGNNYGLALAITAGIVAIAVAAVTAFGPEERGVIFGDR